MQRFFTCTSPSAGAGTDTVASSKLSATGAPTIRLFRRISRDVVMVESPSCLWFLRLRWFSILKSEDSAAQLLHEDQGVRSVLSEPGEAKRIPPACTDCAGGLLDRAPEPRLINRLPRQR